MLLFKVLVVLAVIGACAAFGPMPFGKHRVLPQHGRDSRRALAWRAYLIASISFLVSLVIVVLVHGFIVDEYDLAAGSVSEWARLGIAAGAIALLTTVFFTWIWWAGVRKYSPWMRFRRSGRRGTTRL